MLRAAIICLFNRRFVRQLRCRLGNRVSSVWGSFRTVVVRVEFDVWMEFLFSVCLEMESTIRNVE